jgi:hypothetical protein
MLLTDALTEPMQVGGSSQGDKSGKRPPLHLSRGFVRWFPVRAERLGYIRDHWGTTHREDCTPMRPFVPQQLSSTAGSVE